MGKLHEVLAVEQKLKGQSDRVVKETLTNFTKKAHLFTGKVRNYQPNDDGGECLPSEDVEMVTTVPARLEYTWNSMLESIDVTFQKEVTNTTAKADVVIDGSVLLKDIPATSLITLETRMKEIRAIVDKVPTLEPGKGWQKEPALENTWKSKELRTARTKKIEDYKEVSPATKEHPAQIAKITEDRIIGYWSTTEISGELTSDQKHIMLSRIDKLIREITKARTRANSEEVVERKIAKDIISYIMG